MNIYYLDIYIQCCCGAARNRKFLKVEVGAGAGAETNSFDSATLYIYIYMYVYIWIVLNIVPTLDDFFSIGVVSYYIFYLEQS
jgi:hypothetical protein